MFDEAHWACVALSFARSSRLSSQGVWRCASWKSGGVVGELSVCLSVATGHLEICKADEPFVKQASPYNPVLPSSKPSITSLGIVKCR